MNKLGYVALFISFLFLASPLLLEEHSYVQTPGQEFENMQKAKENAGNRGPSFWLGQDYPEGKVKVGFYSTGEFIMNTYDGRSLLYPGDTSGWTFQVDGHNYVSYNGQTTSFITSPMQEVQDGTHRNASIEYQFGSIHAVVRYQLITNTTKIMLNVTNTGGSVSSFGARYLYDTCNGDPSQYDGSPILIPKATGNVTFDHEQTFEHIDIEQYPNEGFRYFCGLENPNSQHPEFWSTGYLGPDHEAVVPDKLTLAYWQTAFTSAWEYPANPNLQFTNPAMTNGYPDSCVMAYWMPKSLMPGESWNITTYFGNGVPPLFDYRDLRIMQADNEDTLIHHIQPGGETTYNLTVLNLGTIKDTVKLSIKEQMPEGWNASLSEDEFELASLQKRNVVLTVRAPRDNVTYGQFVNATVYGYMLGDSDINDEASTVTIIDLLYDLKVEFAGDMMQSIDGEQVPVSQISQGETKIYTLSVTNMGNINDSYHIEVEDYPPGWDVKFVDGDPTSFDVNLSSAYWGNDKTSRLVQITAPAMADANTIADIWVHGQSLQDPRPTPAQDEGRLRLIVGASSKIELSFQGDNDKKSIYPGEYADFKISAKNKGNTMVNIDLHIQGPFISASEPTDEDWAVEIMPEKIQLNPLARNDNIILRVHGPKKALNGQMITVQIYGKAYSEDGGIQGARSNNLFATVNIKPFLNFTAYFNDNQTINVMPGEQGTMAFTIVNMGNAPSDFTPGISDMPNQWDFNFQDTDGNTLTSLTIGPYSQDVLVFVFDPTAETDTGTWDVILNITSGNMYKQIKGSVHVLQIYNLSASPITTDYEVSPGLSAPYCIEISNPGNGEDTYEISISDLPGGAGWYGYFYSIVTGKPARNETEANFNETIYIPGVSPYTEVFDNSSEPQNRIKITLGPHQSVEVNLIVVTPSTAEAKVYDFFVDVKSTESSMEDKNNRFNLSVKQPDVTISRISCPKSVKKGEITTIRVYLKNIGDIMATNVDVSVYANGHKIGSTTIVTIIPGATQLATVTWRPSKTGEITVKAKADPENKISEINENNNELSVKVAVDRSSTLDIPSFGWILPVSALPIAMILNKKIGRSKRKR